jgi:hypothetical protein
MWGGEKGAWKRESCYNVWRAFKFGGTEGKAKEAFYAF